MDEIVKEYLYMIANFELIRLYICKETYVAQVGDCWIKNLIMGTYVMYDAIIKFDTKIK